MTEMLPKGDVLIHAGDWTGMGQPNEIEDFIVWFDELKQYKHKVCIAGNHDWSMSDDRRHRYEKVMSEVGITYLNQSEAEIDGIKFYGAPHQPEFGGWAFNVPRRSEGMRTIWDGIPLDTQVLITHGPPYQILDITPDGTHCGCEVLQRRLYQLPMLKAHIFGHIHHSYGVHEHDMGVTFINAASCNERYRATNRPIVIEV
jgi:Icc-related predicted phosphoesterase